MFTFVREKLSNFFGNRLPNLAKKRKDVCDVSTDEASEFESCRKKSRLSSVDDIFRFKLGDFVYAVDNKVVIRCEITESFISEQGLAYRTEPRTNFEVEHGFIKESLLYRDEAAANDQVHFIHVNVAGTVWSQAIGVDADGQDVEDANNDLQNFGDSEHIRTLLVKCMNDGGLCSAELAQVRDWSKSVEESLESYEALRTVCQALQPLPFRGVPSIAVAAMEVDDTGNHADASSTESEDNSPASSVESVEESS